MAKQTTSIAAAALLLLAVAGTATYIISGKSPAAASNTATTSGSSRTSPAPGSALEEASGATRTKRGTRPEREESTDLRFKPDAVAAMMKSNLKDFNFGVTGYSAMPEFCIRLNAERETKINDALLLMGASESEAGEAVSILRKAKADLLAVEKQKVKVIHADSTGVTLDLSGMKDAVNEATAKAKESLRSAVPSDLSGPLINAIDWDGFYFNNGGTEANFKVIRVAGGYIAWSFSANSGSLNHIIYDLKDDGTPIPADQLFGERWAPFLKGKELLPVDES